jgi:uroporphyrin-III C-methyltransferase
MDIFTANGKAETPVAIIQNGTLPNEKIVIGNVKDIVYRAQYAEITNPAIIMVGDVVTLHPSFVKNVASKEFASVKNFRITE